MVGMGKGEGLRLMGQETIEKAFPRIRNKGYKITSPETADYNCFAWAANDTLRWWSPGVGNGYYWLDGVPKTLEVESFIKLYKSVGNFVPCSERHFESGFEKIAIYADAEGNVTHVARQLPSGAWTSKLGDWEDIQHEALDAIEGKFYGIATQIMKRSA
jgi:hypothetical protein